MTTAGQVVDRVLNTWLLGTYSAQFNALDGDIGDSSTEFTCAFPLTEIATGSFVAIDDELMVVIERDATNNRLSVARGARGTAAAAHTGGAAVEVNPRFPRVAIRGAMREECDGWPDTLYVPNSILVDIASSAGTIAVPGDINGLETIGVLRVRRASLNTLDDRFRPTVGYEVQGDWGGGGGTIALAESLAITSSFNVTCACRFDSGLFADADVLGDLGFTRGMAEILELGAAYRLLMGRASARLFPEAQGQSRSAQEVGARDIPAFAQSLLSLHERAVVREVERLYRRYGFGGR